LFYRRLAEGRTLATFRFSLKNARDKFDPYLPSQRRGWLTPEGAPPEPTGWVKRILDDWNPRGDSEIATAVLAILGGTIEHPPRVSEEWPLARRRLEQTTRQTVLQSGKIQRRILKNKELRCDNLELALDELLARQGYRCAQTGVFFIESDPELRASLDRIDSDGHYEDGSLDEGANNLQLVTHWYNMAKGTRSDVEMLRLLKIHAQPASQAETDIGSDPRSPPPQTAPGTLPT
jgi:hypothetical protein